MRAYNLIILIWIAAYISGCKPATTAKVIPDQVAMTKQQLADKIKGGWAAKTIGCTYGGPVEFMYNGTMIQDYTPIKWSKDRVKFYFEQFPGLYDDIYVNITFVDAFDRLGLDAPTDSLAVAFAGAGFPLWHANQAARYNIRQGIMPPMSGYWLNNPHADDIDYQIEADFVGLMTPGMPNAASEISDKVGHIFAYGDGWYGGVYVGALYSLAFVSDDMLTVVEGALGTIPKESDFHACIRDIIDCYKLYPDDWKRTWFECQKKWTSEVGCPDGVFMPFDIDAKVNSAYVTIGLLYGEKDFFKTIDIAARCGQDADCNPATAAGVLGTMIGYSGIPEFWKESLSEVMDIPFAYTDVSLNKLYDLSLKHALLEITKEGGKIKNDTVIIQVQKQLPVKYEKSFEGHYPIDKIAVNTSIENVTELTFDGIGFVQRGYVKCADEDYVAKVEMFLDRDLVETANLPVAKSNSIDSRRLDLFFKYQLTEGTHKIKFHWMNPRPDAYIYFGETVIYGSQPNKLNYN